MSHTVSLRWEEGPAVCAAQCRACERCCIAEVYSVLGQGLTGVGECSLWWSYCTQSNHGTIAGLSRHTREGANRKIAFCYNLEQKPQPKNMPGCLHA